MRVEIEDGKYTYVFNNGESKILRYGEEWRDAARAALAAYEEWKK